MSKADRLPLRLPALALLAVALLLPGAAAPPAPEPRLSVPRGADLETVLRALAPHVPGVLAADVSGMPARLGAPLVDAPLDRALARVSVEFDRSVIRQGPNLILQRRFSDPDEEPGPELEELRQASELLHRLLQPFSPWPRLDSRLIRDQNEFAASLTPAQQQAMIQHGLPLADLPPAQQRAWLRVNAAKAFTNSTHEIRKGRQCLASWSRVIMEDLTAPPGRERRMLAFAYPDPLEERREGRISMPVAAPNGPPRRLQPQIEERAPSGGRSPESLRPVWPLPLRKLELGRLPAELSNAGGPQLVVPAYAGRRAFWVASRGTRAEVLAALAELWGWAVVPAASGYRLGPAGFVPARSPDELHARLLRAVPPPTRHMAAAVSEGATARWGRQLELVFQAAERTAVRDWRQVRVAELEPAAQQRLANLLLMLRLQAWYQQHGRRAELPAWVRSPERGVLRLGSAIRPGATPLLSFEVPVDGRTRQFWGFHVNTSTLAR